MGTRAETSRKEKAILKFIEDQVMEKGYPPSVREIGKAIGLSSTATVHAYLAKLEKQGYIKKEDKKGDSSLNSSDKDEDITAPTSSTVNKVQELLEKIEGKDKGGDDDDDEDIDVDDYINNLDKKAK